MARSDYPETPGNVPSDATRSDVEIAKSCFEYAGRLKEAVIGKTETPWSTTFSGISTEGRDYAVALLKEAGDALLRRSDDGA